MRIKILIVLGLVFFYVKILYADPLLRPWSQHNHEDFETGIIKTDTFNGKVSAYLKSRDFKKIGRGTLWQGVKPPRQWLNERIKMTAYMKTINVKTGSGLFLKFGFNNTFVTHDFMYNRVVTGNTDWTKYEIVLDMPLDTHLISFGAWLVGKGEVRIDNVKFERVGLSIDVTSEYIERQTDGVPKNLNFESMRKK